MRVAHVCVVTPGRCGLYETAREMVVGLRRIGVDSRLVDVPSANKVFPQGYPQPYDRGAPTASMGWAAEADLIVNHSGYDGTPLQHTDQPVVYVAHGRPMSSFLTEDAGGSPVYTYLFNKNQDPRWRAVVTLWAEHVPYLQAMFPDKPVHHVQSPVDLEYWCPGESGYDFHGNRAELNVVCADPKRLDNNALIPLTAFANWARQRRGARIHVYGGGLREMGAFRPVLERIRRDGNLGALVEWSPDLRAVYRAADLVLTSSGIDTRSVREAMACGCPVLQVGGDVRGADIDAALRQTGVRDEAERRFSPAVTAQQLRDVLNDSLPR